MQVSSLFKLVEKIKPGEDSNYFLLHTIISLVSLAVGSEDLSSKERVRNIVWFTARREICIGLFVICMVCLQIFALSSHKQKIAQKKWKEK